MRYLSPQWIDAARQALTADEALPTALVGVTLTIEQVVADVPSARRDAGPAGTNGAASGLPVGTARWHVAITDGRVTLAAGAAPEPDLRFTTTYGTAAQVASGALSAQRAFVEGRLRVGGDLSLLITHQRAFAAIDDALAAVRAQTTYDVPTAADDADATPAYNRSADE